MIEPEGPREIAKGLLSGKPRGLFVDSEGNILVATDQKKVQIINWREGRVMGTLRGMRSPLGVVMDGEGRVIVTDCKDYQVHIY